MTGKNEIEESRKYELLNIFVEEEDRKGTDLLAMSNFFDIFTCKIEADMQESTTWKMYDIAEDFTGEIASAIKGGYDVSKMGMLVADHSHFSKEIIDGLKSGIYHIGESKEVAGNLRPAILDKDGHLVKFFTLKKAINPTNVLSDLFALSMQGTLQKISAQIEDIGRSVQGLMDFNRRETLSNKFIYARDRIMLAASADDDEERTEYLKDADQYLMEGLSDLYSDIDSQVKNLSKQKGPLASIKTIDSLLSYINEDMQMIPKYVGVRVYLFYYRGMTSEANRILGEYQYQLKRLTENKVGNGKYTALELIHMNYPYSENNVNFWLEQPKQMLEAIDSCKDMIEQGDEGVFYIDVEDDEKDG